MFGIRLYATATTKMFRRKTFNTSSVIRATSSNAAAVEAAGSSIVSKSVADNADKETEDPYRQEPENVKKEKHSLVAAAFENLKQNSDSGAKLRRNYTGNGNIEERINNAKTINGLLSVTEGSTLLSRKQALKIVSILAEWSTANRIKLNEFENDSRFLKVCRMLGRTPKNGNATGNEYDKKRISGFRTDDLNTVLGVAGDDEAAKLIASISLPQMVKVMSTLASRKRRSTPLLRSLAFNISSATESLDLKQCADILFAMATLNFQDPVLAAKVCADVQTALPKNKDKSAVIGSILTSLGILKYRDLDILESLTEWVLQNSNICRPQDVSALFLTSAVLNFKTNIEDFRQNLVNTVAQQDFSKSVDWLSHVWALAMLNMCNNEHLESVLVDTFIDKLKTDKSGLTTTSKMKLLNLNSYARLMANDYKGPTIADDNVEFNIAMTHSKSKQDLVNGLMDVLKSLLPANNYVKSLVDSKMGFLIDAICVFDDKLNPLPIDKGHANGIKVALMVVDYNDICHGTHRSTSGITSLNLDLLEKSGYKVIPIPHNDFSNSDKLLKRVQYLESKLKEIITADTK